MFGEYSIYVLGEYPILMFGEYSILVYYVLLMQSP